jgi:transcriptional regulator with XRE-family HTH domain
MPKAVEIDDFAAKLGLLCKKLNWSRAKLAQQAAIDKSLASRWLAGGSRPTGNTLMRLNEVMAKALPGFAADSWDLDLAGLAERFGASPPRSAAGAPVDAVAGGRHPLVLPLRSFARFAEEIDYIAPLYEGFYYNWFCSPTNDGAIYRRRGRIVRRDNQLVASGAGISFEYEVTGFVAGDRLYMIGENPRFSGPIFIVLNGTTSGRRKLLAGLTLFQSTASGALGIACLPMSLEFREPLSGDEAVDARTWAAMEGEAREFPAGQQDEVPAPVLQVLRTLSDSGQSGGPPGHILLLRAPG